MDTINRMQAFVVVESGGFCAAARTTGRSKALMSKYVAELEQELGGRLLNRTMRPACDCAYEIDDLGVYIVYPHREHMPAKLRAFIDHLVSWYEAERRAVRTS